MSEATLTLLIQLFFWGLALLALANLARFRDHTRLDIALVMLSVALALTPPTWYHNIALLELTPSTLALVAHPYLLLRLVRHFRRLRPIISRLALVGMVLTGLVMTFSSGLNLFWLIVSAYFIGVEGYAISAFIRSARVSSGVSRWRLLLIALGILTLLLAILTFIPFRETLTTNSLLFFAPITLTIAAGAAFYLGFAPPRWLRKYWQLRELNYFLHAVPAQYAGMELAYVVEYLCHFAARSVDSITAVAAMLDPEEEQLIVTPPAEYPELAAHISAQSGRLGRVWLERGPFFATNHGDMGQVGLQLTLALGANGILTVPISTPVQAYGLLLVFCRQKPLFVDDDLDLLSLLTAQAARTLSYSHLLVSERKARTRAEILAQVASRLSANIELEQTVAVICEATWQATNRSFAAIFTYDDAANNFRFWHGAGHFGGLLKLSQPLPTAAQQQLMAHDQPLLLSAIEPNGEWPEAEKIRAAGIHSLAHAPLIYKEQLIGLLTIGSIGAMEPVADEEMALLQGIADQAAMAVQNGRLYQEVQEYNNELENRVAQRTADLQARNEELDAFAHTVAHDLKMPITHMVGLAETVANKFEALPPADRQRYLGIIQQSGEKMASIIDALLLLAGVREMEIPLAPLDMEMIVDEARQRLAHLNRQYGVRVHLPDSWPQALGYAPWVEEIWFNYLSNGMKYGGHPPELTLGATAVTNNMIKFWIQDNGLGISPAAREKLFVPFTQLNLRRDSGYGLGLSIVQRIADRLGGEVGAESLPGKGGLFWFTLPALTNETVKGHPQPAHHIPH
ncbi:MAG: GAF domain-containing sensor histidine kinase [Anaerolineaceae bacterium]|nr:GAF domain-containing sensor histidine kinase [Anaerolineaceae bacterium]